MARKTLQTLLSVEKDKDYFSRILDEILKSDKKVCYVSFNKTFFSIKDSFKDNKLSEDKFYVVDCISASMFSVEKNTYCSFIEDPKDTSGIAKGITKALDKGYNFVIVDMLSNLRVHIDPTKKGKGSLVYFLENIISEINKKDGRGIYICYQNEVGEDEIQNSLLLFNKFVIKGNRLFGEIKS